ncbi:MAG TPA: polysaccharide deacetylase family protein [Methylomirabilota bacterium]|nr:polysaccharide deacetylase family protein [Methylomirabilota bacterium]
MIGGALALGAAAWVSWAWLPHLLTPVCVWHGPRVGRRLALTFDDGPDPDWTPRVLDALGEAGVRATFFLLGERAERAPAVVRRMAAAGHEIGNHSWSHRSFWLRGPRATASEIRRAHECLGALAGAPPRHFRPPWGMVNAAMFPVLRRLGERCVFWSIQPEGLRPVPPARQIAHVMDHAHPGAIVDLHDAEGTREAPARLLAALPPLLEGLRERGYAFATVVELLSTRD